MKKVFLSLLLSFAYLYAALPVFAQTSLVDSGCLLSGNRNDVATLSCFPVIVANVIIVLLTLVGVVALVLIIFSGFKLLTSGGDPKKVDGARKTLTFTVLGLALVLLAYFIVITIGKTTGVACINGAFNFDQCGTLHECRPGHAEDCPNPRRFYCSSAGQCTPR